MLYNAIFLPTLFVLFLQNPLANTKKEYMQVTINNKEYNMEVANTSYKKSKGLMFTPIGAKDGMIFTYNKPTPAAYYNKNVRFNIRIYFLNEQKQVVNSGILVKDSFKQVRSGSPIMYVVEVPLKKDSSNDPGENATIVIN